MEALTKRNLLRILVQEKNRWSRPLTPQEKTLGFLGWHQRGYLPHCDFPNLVQFVTIRLADSLPVSRIAEWRHLLKISDTRERRAKLEACLDRGRGVCHLRNASIARVVEETLLHFDRQRYDLRAWCVMPNHVHVLVEVRNIPLSSVVRSWKQCAQVKVRERANVTAFCWQRDYWDTFMRDESQLRKTVRYIENNPVKAGLCLEPKNWPFGSARFRDEYDRLIMPA